MPTIENTPPTKHPTIALSDEDDEYDIVPIQFTVSGIPDNIQLDSIKNEMEIVLKRIILRLAGNIDGLKVSKVEAVEMSLNLRQRQRQLRLERALEEEVTQYFHVYLIRDDEDKQYGPYIISEIHDSYDEVLTQIQ